MPLLISIALHLPPLRRLVRLYAIQKEEFVNEHSLLPPHAQQGAIIGVDRDIKVCMLNLLLGLSIRGISMHSG